MEHRPSRGRAWNGLLYLFVEGKKKVIEEFVKYGTRDAKTARRAH